MLKQNNLFYPPHSTVLLSSRGAKLVRTLPIVLIIT